MTYDALATALNALNALRPTLGDAAVDKAIAALRQRSSAPGELPVRPEDLRLRQVSILFCDIVDSTDMRQGLDTEDALEVMGTALRRFAALVEAAGGRVLRFTGDGLKAAFGSEQTREDDAQRAVAAGLEVLDAAARHSETLQRSLGLVRFAVRVGINTGDVMLGGGAEENNSAMGHAVHVAARLEHAAPPGRLLIGERTWSLVRGDFEVQRRPPLTVKGVEAPLENYIVLRARPSGFRRAGRGIEGVTTRLVGRDAQLLALQEALAHSSRPGAGLQRVLVIGEAGVGKSRLLDEFEHWAEASGQAWRPLRTRATPQTPSQPYALLRELLGSHLGLLDGDSMEQAKRKIEDAVPPLLPSAWDEKKQQMHVHWLGQLIGLDYSDSAHVKGVDARQRRDGAFQAAAQALRHAGASGAPPLLLLDDVQWADEGSLDFLEHMTNAHADAPMLMLALARPTLLEQRPAWCEGAQRLPIDPLGDADSARLTHELLQRLTDVPQGLLALITRRAEGNPFFMEELVTMLIGQGAIQATGERWSVDEDRLQALRVPPTLTGVLQARLDALQPREREALQLASVIGVHFWDAALAHVQPQAEAQLQALARRDLVHLEDAAGAPTEAMLGYAFRHQLLHQVTYDTVLKPVKRQAHARAADWLARHAGTRNLHLLASAAEHYERAGDAVNAVEFHAQAAAYMQVNFANQLAIEHATRALNLLSDDMPEALSQRWRLLRILDLVYDLLARRPEQLANIEAMLAVAERFPPGDMRRAESAQRRGYLAGRMADWPTAERTLRQALALAEEAADEPTLVKAQSTLATALCVLGKLDEAQALGLSALTRARALGDVDAEAECCISMSIVSSATGDGAANVAYLVKSMELAQHSSNRRRAIAGLSNVGAAYNRFGALDLARSHLLQALEEARAIDYREVEGATLLNLSMLCWRESKPAQGLAYAQAALELQRTVQSPMHLMLTHNAVGLHEFDLGRFDTAAQAYERTLAMAREVGHLSCVIVALTGLGEVALARGDLTQAKALAEQVLAEAGAASGKRNPLAGEAEHWVRLMLYRIWSAAGDPRAQPMLAEAHAMLMAEAAHITDSALRESFLTNLPETREIVALWARVRAA